MDADKFRLTHQALRRLLITLPALLFVATVLMALRFGTFETSISAYYGGPLRDLFVGLLIATAACLIAYRSPSQVEEYNLLGAAFYLIFVALVPTGLEDILDDLRTNLTLSPDGMSPAEYVWSLRISLTLVVGLCIFVLLRRIRRASLRQADRWAKVFMVVTLTVLAAFFVLALWQVWVPRPDEVTLNGLGITVRGGTRVQIPIHHLAALFFMAALLVAVWSHAWPRAAARREGSPQVAVHEVSTQNRYRVIAGLMLAGPLVAWGLSALIAPAHFVLILEWWEIALFSVFWALETAVRGRVLVSRPAAELR